MKMKTENENNYVIWNFESENENLIKCLVTICFFLQKLFCL